MPVFKKRFLTMFLAILCVSCLMITCSAVAFADDPASGGLDAAGNNIVNGVTNGLNDAWKIIKAIAGPIGAIAIIICGVKMLWGSAKSAEEAKGALIRIVIAMAIIFIGPWLVSSIKSWFVTSGEQDLSSVFGTGG